MIVRTPLADLLKGIAVLLMVQVHVLELFATNEIYKSHLGKILLFIGAAPVAPVFSIVFGYFIVSSKKSKTELIVRGLKLIGLGMLLNIALNLNLIISVTKGNLQIDLLPFIFGFDILHFAGISSIIIALLKNILQQHILFLIGCIICAALLGHGLLNFVPQTIFLKYFLSIFYGSCEWSYFPIFPWIAYPLTGIAFYTLKEQSGSVLLKVVNQKLLLGILFLLFFIFTIKYAVTISSDLPSYYHHGIIFYLWTIVFIAFYSIFMNEIGNKLGHNFIMKYFNWLGENVTLIYVIQWILIGNIATEIYKTVLQPKHLFYYYLVVMILSSTCAYLFLKLRVKLNRV
jgi:uncharacterized membrane protein